MEVELSFQTWTSGSSRWSWKLRTLVRHVCVCVSAEMFVDLLQICNT